MSIKKLKLDASTSEDKHLRVLKEMKTLSKLRQVRIMICTTIQGQYHEFNWCLFGTKNLLHCNRIYLLQQFCKLTSKHVPYTLEQYLPKISSITMLRKIALSACRGLNFLHNLQPPIIHRNLCCQTILVWNSIGIIASRLARTWRSKSVILGTVLVPKILLL